MPLALRYVTHSEIGLVRKNNQDSGYASPTMLMVADGMGGAAAGDLASAVAIHELQKTDGKFAGTEMLTVVAGAIHRANDQIADLVKKDSSLDGMGTTVCGVLFDGEKMALANIGDSRGYRVRDGEMERLTRDHSWVQTLIDEGRITEAEALVHPHRSLILKVLNGQPTHQPDLEMIDVRLGDRLMFCSDGLCGLATDETIAGHITGEDRQEVMDALVKVAHDEGGVDNITIIIADVVEGEPTGEVQIMGAAADPDLLESATTEDTKALPDTTPRPDPERAERDRYDPRPRRRVRTWLRVLLAVLLPVLVIAGGAGAWYSYTQTQYYVAADDDTVAIFQGVPDKVLSLSLSRVVESTNTHLTDLPPFYQEKVRATIKVTDLESARGTIEELRIKAEKCIAQREERARATQAPPPTPTPKPTTSPTKGKPSTTPGASPTRTASPTPTPTSTPGAPEEC